jgi:hypothetical protein
MILKFIWKLSKQSWKTKQNLRAWGYSSSGGVPAPASQGPKFKHYQKQTKKKRTELKIFIIADFKIYFTNDFSGNLALDKGFSNIPFEWTRVRKQIHL